MKDQLKNQISDKVKNELMQKVDEVKADVESKFASFGAPQRSDQRSESPQIENLEASRTPSESSTQEGASNDSTNLNEEETQEPAAVGETNLEDDSGIDDETKVA